MFDGPEAVTRAILSRALDAASLRQQVIAANIANANVADYTPMTVNFESRLKQVLSSDELRGLDSNVLADVQPSVEPIRDAFGSPAKVMLDVEVSKLAQNAVHYQALIKCLSRQNMILATAVSDGKK